MDVYLDNAATSRSKPECVVEAMARFMREVGASPGRSVHGPGIEAGRIVAAARQRTAALFGVADSSRIVFASNCTEALNLVVKGLLREGDHVVTSSLEHNSVMRPLSALGQAIRVSRMRCTAEGVTDPADLRRQITDRTALVVMTHASNVCGTLQPIAECGRIARERGIPLLVDAAQTAGCVPIDIGELSVDMLAFSGHKGLMGPQGVGGLYIREGLEPKPLKHGGTGSRSSQELQPEFLPDKYESGTPNTPGLAGLAAALEFLATETVDAVRARICGLGTMLLEGLCAVDRVILYGTRDMSHNAGVFSFRIEGLDPGEVAARLEEQYGVMTRVGLHCAPAAHHALGTFPDGTIRASIGFHTTEQEIEAFLAAVRAVATGTCHGRP